MEGNTKREFTGVFIPAHIWISKELTPAEKMMCGEIDALSKRTGWCDASRSHFAEWLQCEPSNISGYWKKLEGLGFLEIERRPGFRSRIRLNQQRFWQNEPVSPTDPYPSAPLTTPVSPTDPYPSAPLTRNISINTKEKEYVKDALTPTVTDVPRFNTPTELEEHLRNFFSAYPEEWRLTLEAANMAYSQNHISFNDTERKTAISKYCEWAVEEIKMHHKSFAAHNARLRRWLRDQASMSVPKPQPTSTGKGSGIQFFTSDVYGQK